MFVRLFLHHRRGPAVARSARDAVHEERARSSLRFSFGRYNTEAELDKRLEILPRIVRKLRQLSASTGLIGATAARATPNAHHENFCGALSGDSRSDAEPRTALQREMPKRSICFSFGKLSRQGLRFRPVETIVVGGFQ